MKMLDKELRLLEVNRAIIALDMTLTPFKKKETAGSLRRALAAARTKLLAGRHGATTPTGGVTIGALAQTLGGLGSRYRLADGSTITVSDWEALSKEEQTKLRTEAEEKTKHDHDHQ